MKIKISKSQWELMGKKAGWMKTAYGPEIPRTETSYIPPPTIPALEGKKIQDPKVEGWARKLGDARLYYFLANGYPYKMTEEEIDNVEKAVQGDKDALNSLIERSKNSIIGSTYL